MHKTTPKIGGRPKQNRMDKKQKVVSTKLTEIEFYAIRKRASDAGIKISEYLRQSILKVGITPRLNKQDAQTIRQLAGEANNLNQLARKAHSKGFLMIAEELITLKNKIIEIINHLSNDWQNNKRKRL